MSISRIAPAIGIIVGLSAGCVSGVVPTPSTTPAQSTESTPTATTSASASGEPGPSESVAPPGDASVWLPAGDLGEARNTTNLALLGTGEVLVVGSDYGTSWGSSCGASTNGSDSVEIGDPQMGVWQKTTSMPNLRDGPTVVALLDGRVLLTGGAAGEHIGWSAYSSTYVFDPTTRLWSRSGLLNTARAAAAAAVLLDGRVLVAGGTYMDRESPDPPRILDTSELWDPRSGTWTRTGRLDDTRVGASAVTLADGRVLIVGGVASLQAAPIEQASAEVYDPATGRWGSAGALTTARRGFVLVALRDGGAIVAGGFGELAASGYLSTVERFDPVSNTWSAADDLPFPVAGAAGIGLADGRVLVAGGSIRPPETIDANAGTYVSGLTADAELFDPETGTWTPAASMPGPRAGASGLLLADGSAVVAGGSVAEGPEAVPGCPDAAPQVFRYVPGP